MVLCGPFFFTHQLLPPEEQIPSSSDNFATFFFYLILQRRRFVLCFCFGFCAVRNRNIFYIHFHWGHFGFFLSHKAIFCFGPHEAPWPASDNRVML